MFKFSKLNTTLLRTYDFIFSNQPRYRVSRHLVFWLLWFVFMLLAIHIPETRFPNWQVEYNEAFVEKKGGMVNYLWTMTYRRSWFLLCDITFTYVLIYYILPRYYVYREKWLNTTAILILLFVAYLVWNYFFEYLTHMDNIKQDARAHLPLLNAGVLARVKNVLFSATFNFATVVGFAVIIKLMKRWLEKQKETALVVKEKANAELQLLKAQVHPHFLFNSLNNIYSFTLSGSPKAPEMIQKLLALLRYILEECKQLLVPLETELKMIKDYISLERIRYGDRLKIDVQITGSGNAHMISPLLLIPFVENCFKHGASQMLMQPYVQLDVSIKDGILYFKLLNSKPSATEELSLNGNGGLGLKNVKKRLELIYPNNYELKIINDPTIYSVQLQIALTETVRK